jgi:probable F420-dependent oxidoreductase
VKVRFAVSPATELCDDEVLADVVDALEVLGFDTVWLSDVPMGAQVDPLVGLSFAAGRTKRLKLGANLVPIGRNPMLLAKELAQLDRLSRGRVLLSLVPGLDQPGERQSLGVGGANRGGFLDEIIPLLRTWWSGDVVEHRSERFSFPGITVRPTPQQHPLEIWLGGIGPAALRRAGRLSDGWLGATITPDEAAVAVTRIVAAATEEDRTIDPEHFGLSIPYAHSVPDERMIAALRSRRPDGDLSEILPVGPAQLRHLIGRHVDQGLSKFVVRPLPGGLPLRDELDLLATALLDLQT